MVEFKLDDDTLLKALAGQLVKSLPDAERSRLVDALEVRLVCGDGPRTIQRLIVEKSSYGPDLVKDSDAWAAFENVLLHGNCSYTWVGRDAEVRRPSYNCAFDIRFEDPINPVLFLSDLSLYKPTEAYTFVVENKIPVLRIGGDNFYCGDNKSINLRALGELLRQPYHKGYVRSPTWDTNMYGQPHCPYVLPAKPQ